MTATMRPPFRRLWRPDVAYPFVRSFHDLGVRRGPVLGFVVHMAEGGGTVNYLAKQNPNGVSVHYVIERTGRIVQMLREDHMHTSIRTSAIRMDTESDGFYGRKAALAVLGRWADITTTLGPNHATIAAEVEGFAASGPNTAQHGSLRTLVNDVRSRFPDIGLLGHRDLNVKTCPGRLIDWASLGGHGPKDSTEPPSMIEQIPPGVKVGTIVVNGPGHSYLRLIDGELVPVGAGFTKSEAIGPVVLRKGTVLGDSLARRTGYVTGLDAAFFLGVDVTFTPAETDQTHTVTVNVDGQEKASLTI